MHSYCDKTTNITYLMDTTPKPDDLLYRFCVFSNVSKCSWCLYESRDPTRGPEVTRSLSDRREGGLPVSVGFGSAGIGWEVLPGEQGVEWLSTLVSGCGQTILYKKLLHSDEHNHTQPQQDMTPYYHETFMHYIICDYMQAHTPLTPPAV